MTAENTVRAADSLLARGRRDEAEALYAAVLDREQDNPAALFGLGNIAADRGRFGLAASLYRRSLGEMPEMSTSLNLASALKRLGRMEEADTQFKAAESLIGTLPQDIRGRMAGSLYGNWSGCFINAGNPNRALELARKGLDADPNNLDAHNHRALALLEKGLWKEAYPHWQKRLQRRGFHRRNYAPEWDGGETDLLVVHGEQGLGDEVLFMTAFREAVKKARTVVVECAERLVPVFARSLRVPCYATEAELIANLPRPATAQIAMGSLFIASRDKPADCPGTPYLRADGALVREYRDRLETLGRGKKVGLTWRGGTEKTHKAVRTPPLKAFTPLLGGDAVLVSLQYGADAAIDADTLQLHHWQLAIEDIDRQIALIAALDEVVSVCQSVVHFAGAVGTPCHVLVPSAPRWCYGITGLTMPAYKSVILYRQVGDDWSVPVNAIAAALRIGAAAAA